MDAKKICYLTRARIEGEAARAAFMGFGCMACPYDGERREIWIKAFRDAKDD